MSSPRRAFTLCSLLGLTALPAQKPAREAAIGEVRDRDGKPWEGATVHLLHRAHPGLTDPRFQDRVEIQVDARGRFRADVLTGMPYTAWATKPAAAGAFTSTEVRHGVVAGVPTVLAEVVKHHPRQVLVTIDASWTTPLTFFARAGLGDLELVQELQVADGAFTTPAWPVSQVRIDVRSGGQRVHLETITTSGVSLTEADGSIEPTSLLVPERQATAFALQDRDGKPIAHATLFIDRAPFAEPLVTTRCWRRDRTRARRRRPRVGSLQRARRAACRVPGRTGRDPERREEAAAARSGRRHGRSRARAARCRH